MKLETLNKTDEDQTFENKQILTKQDSYMKNTMQLIN